MNKLIPFPDQVEVIDDIRAQMRSSKSILLQSCTGSGKTVMAMIMVMAALEKGGRVGFTVPRRNLLEQTSNSFKAAGISHSYIAAGKFTNPNGRCFIGSIETMSRRIDKLPPLNLVFFDETHFGSNSLGKVIDHYKNMGAWVIGLSATPWKLSGRGLGCWYDSMVTGKSMRWLIDNKRLSDYRYFVGANRPNTESLRMSAGDYNKADLASLMESAGTIIGDCVKDYRDRSMGRLHVVRCASIKHSQMTAQAFRDNGIPAAHVDGKTDDIEMRRIIRGFARRELYVLTFCDLLNFGFDLAQSSGMDVCIESGSDLKPSKSLAGQMQFWGRMLRMKEYPAIINDHVNNWVEHGFPCTDRLWTLADRPQKKNKATETIATKRCDNCYHLHRPMPKCPECGFVYEIVSREIEEEDGELIEVDPRKAIIDRKKEQYEAKDIDSLAAVGRKRGMKYPEKWAVKVMAARMKKERLTQLNK